MSRCGICSGKKIALEYETHVVGLVRRLLVCLLCDFGGKLPAPRK